MNLRSLKYLGFSLLLWSSMSWAEWPSLPFPADAKVESIGEQVRLNGVPMRMYRILDKQNTKSILSFYKQALGAQYAETTFNGAQILTQGRGDYFITVRVKPLSPQLTETLVSISDARAAKTDANRPMGVSLPSESVVLSDMESSDTGRNSRHLVFSNQYAIDTNADFLIKTLQSQGYNLQPMYTRVTENSKTMMFEGKKRDARVVITRDDEQSNVELITVQMP